MRTVMSLATVALLLVVHGAAQAEQVADDQMGRLFSALSQEPAKTQALETLEKLPMANAEDPYRNIYAGRVQFETPILITEPAQKEGDLVERLSAAHWLRLDREGNSITGELHLFHTSWPRARWLIEMQLLDAKGSVIASDTQTFENSGYVLGRPEIGREKVAMRFENSDRAEAAQFRLAINTVWTSQSNPIQVDKEMPLHLTLDAPRASALRFALDRLSSGETVAKAHLSCENWPATTWTLTIKLVDEQGKSIANAKETFANGGYIATFQSTRWLDPALDFDRPPDLGKVSRYEVILERLAPARSLDPAGRTGHSQPQEPDRTL